MLERGEFGFIHPSAELMSALEAFAKSMNLTVEQFAKALKGAQLHAENIRLRRALPAPRLDEAEVLKAVEELLKQNRK